MGSAPDSRDRAKLDDLRRDFTLSVAPTTLRIRVAAGIHHLYLLRGDATAATAPTVVSVAGAVVSGPGPALAAGSFAWQTWQLSGGRTGRTADFVLTGVGGNFWRLNALVMY